MSTCAITQPPKMVPCALVSAGIGTMRSTGISFSGSRAMAAFYGCNRLDMPRCASSRFRGGSFCVCFRLHPGRKQKMKLRQFFAAVLAAGITATAFAAADRATPPEAEALVKKAIVHYKKVGKDKALADFMKKD